jgi:hypothetical protein
MKLMDEISTREQINPIKLIQKIFIKIERRCVIGAEFN